MNRFFTRTILCSSMLICTVALANDFGAADTLKKPQGVSSIDHYNASVNVAVFICSMTFSTAQSLAELQRMGTAPSEEQIAKADYKRCITAHRSSLKKIYADAASSIKKPSRKNALKEHYIQSIVMIDGIEPQPEELKIQYIKRQNDQQKKLNELWTRFEID